MSMSIKEETKESDDPYGLPCLKQETIDIKSEEEHTTNNCYETNIIKHEYIDLECVNQEQPDTKPENLITTIQPCSTEKNFTCTFCPYSCVRKTYLTEHLRTHTKDKPYSCTFCDYKCSTNSHLTRHLKTHSEEKPYCCTTCDFKTSWKECLNNHLKTHVNERPHSCTLCNYKSVKKSNLIRHMAKHTREKPYKCNTCEYRCVYKIELEQHQRIHTGKEYKGARKINLRSHATDSLASHMESHVDDSLTDNKNIAGQNQSEFETKNNEAVKIEELYIKQEF